MSGSSSSENAESKAKGRHPLFPSKSDGRFGQGLVLSFALVFLISVVGGIVIYRQLRDSISPQPLQIEVARENIYDVSQILTDLYQSEAYARSYMQTFEQEYYYGYRASLDSVGGRLGLMRDRQLAYGSGMSEKIDTISQILRLKNRNMERLFSSMRELRLQGLEEASRRMIDSLRIELPWVPPRVEVGEYKDTVIRVERTVEDKDGFFKRLSKAFKKERTDTVYYVHQMDRVLEENLLPLEDLHDSLRQAVARTVMEFEDLRQEANARVSRQMDRVLVLDNALNRQIMDVLEEWQKTEVEGSLAVFRERAEDLRRLSKTIAWIGVLSFLVTVFSLFFLLRSTWRSQRRSRALAISEAEKAALLANRDQLMKSIAHDIKSPLGTIIGSTDLLDRSGLSDENRHYLSYTKAASSYLLELVNNLLDYVKWQSGELKSEQTLFEPFKLFDEIQAVYRLQAEEKGLIFRFFVQGKFVEGPETREPGWFKADALRIRQIAGNLLSNAIKYTDTGHVDFRVDWTDSMLELRVQDSGQGIAKEDQEKIFEEFVRVGEDKAGVEGTGIGLSVTLKWVELLHGKLSLESEPGKGSLFTAFLPVQPVDETEVEKLALDNREQQDALPGDSLRNLRVALIDDDRMLQHIVCAYLERLGMEVRATSNPDELFAWATESWPQIVITDLQMPQMSGYEILKRLNAIKADLPVVLLTGKHFVEAWEDSPDEEVRFAAVLQKPVAFPDLMSVMERVLIGREEPGIVARLSVQDAVPDVVPASASDSLPPYDLHSVRTFMGDDPAQLNDFLQEFFDTAYDQVEDLKIQVEEEDWTRLSALAHKMASMLGQLGIMDLHDLLRTWEKGVRPSQADVSGLESRLKAVEACMRVNGDLRKGSDS